MKKLKHISEQPDGAIQRLLSKSKSDWDYEHRNAKLRSEIYQILEEMNAENNIKINICDYVPPELKVRFVKPFLFDISKEKSYNEILRFLKNSKSIHVDISGRKAVKWDVVYDGIIENDKGIRYTFRDISNGLCVNMS